MKKLKSYSWLLLLFALLACTKEIDFELSDESTNRLVVEANFTNAARQHEVKLTRTSTFYEPNETPAETGARVTIVGNNQTVLFDEVRPGVYLNLGMDSGQIGQTYTLQIELANGERYTASETMMRNTVIDSMSYEYFSFASLYNVNIWTQEPAGKGDSYLWNVYINPPLKLDSIRVGVETVNVSQNFFEFVVTALLETEFRGTPFDGPPANIRGNISDGALGYFSVTSVSNRYEFTILTEH